MLPIDFQGSNLILNKPENMTDEECMSINAYKGIDTNNLPYIHTQWMPSKEDIEAVNAGRPICISTLGHSFAPMSVYTCDDKGIANV